MSRPDDLANRVTDRSAATLIAGLLVLLLFANAALWASHFAGS